MTQMVTLPAKRGQFVVPRLVDLVCMLVLLATGVVAFGPVFSGAPGYLAAAGGVLLGTCVAVVSAWRSWSFLATVTVSGVAYLVFGGMFALPGTAAGGVLPTVETLQRLVLLTYQGWRDLLTVSVPASSFTGPAVVPYLSGLVCSLLCLSIALRARRYLWALAPALTLLLIGILWGTKHAPTAAVQGAAFAVTALGWAAWRATAWQQQQTAALLTSRPSNRAALRQRTAAGALILTTAVVAGLVGGSALVTPSDRYVLRDDVVPPMDLRDYASPLTKYRFYERQMKNEPLLTVKGLPDGGRVRLAALDTYDGHVYNVDRSSADFVRIGQEIGSEATDGTTTLEVSIGQYRGVWLPGGGDLREVRFRGTRADSLAQGLHYNDATGTALTTVGLSQGDEYAVDLGFDAIPADASLVEDSIADVAMPDSQGVPEEIAGEAPNFGGSESSQIKMLRAMEAKFRKVGYYSNNDRVATSGHYTRRLSTMFSGIKMIGDDEQYAAAMALMVRQLGYPARVVIGFYPATYPEGSLELTGNDAHVWVEVPFSRAGWVTFDPTPPRDKQPDNKVPEPEERPEPQVLPPPEPPQEPIDPPDDRTDESTNREEQEEIPEAIRVLGYVVGGVALLASPFLLIAAAKTRRRRRRRHSGTTVHRIHESWFELLDAATDWGVATRPRVTRRETAHDLASAFPQASPVGLAHEVDAKVFGVGEPTDADVAAMWRQVDDVLNGMRGSMSRWRRLRGFVSLRSFRRGRARTRAGDLRRAASAAAASVARRAHRREAQGRTTS